MKAFIFYNNSIGDKVIVEKIKSQLDCDVQILNSKVDLSTIVPEERNLIIVINRSILNFDFGYLQKVINEDLNKPLMVVNKFKTFGSLEFDNNYNIKKVSTNKIYPFAGIVYIPKKNFYAKMSDIFKSFDLKELRYLVAKFRGNK